MPDTVDQILGITEISPHKHITKVEMDKVNTKLRKEEKEAWVETTKNIDMDRVQL